MTMLRGVDGCPGGWPAVWMNATNGAMRAEVFPTARDFPQDNGFTVTAIDVPIGLPVSDSRRSDLAARQLLGPRRGSSVFPAPVRRVLSTGSY